MKFAVFILCLLLILLTVLFIFLQMDQVLSFFHGSARSRFFPLVALIFYGIIIYRLFRM
ncbi:MAG: hypothetical protein PHF84_10585 [bacterium]|nr:hypothetical protein [bacterium]